MVIRYEIAFPLVGIGYYSLESEKELSDSDAIKKAFENIQNGEQIDDYNWEVFLREQDASPFPEAQVVDVWKDSLSEEQYKKYLSIPEEDKEFFLMEFGDWQVNKDSMDIVDLLETIEVELKETESYD